MIYFIGAGPGAADLITVRGAKLLEQADVIIYAGSLVNPALLDYAKAGCKIYDSAKMTLEEVIEVMAVPRDIDPKIAGRNGIRCLNIDEISAGRRDMHQERLISKIDSYIEGYIGDFHHWYDYRENMEKKIYVVGIGPGNSEYMTPQARTAIEDSEVVVGYTLYVDLVRDLCDGKTVRATSMGTIPEGTELIDVGKNVGDHPVPQQEINKILLAEAQQGKKVVRLKGGDPFVFGRGGEELELISENDVEFQVVPGITSSISVPAYAGIPVTHRDFCSSLHIITGHDGGHRNSDAASGKAGDLRTYRGYGKCAG